MNPSGQGPFESRTDSKKTVNYIAIRTKLRLDLSKFTKKGIKQYA
jgi:hypothetical protein